MLFMMLAGCLVHSSAALAPSTGSSSGARVSDTTCGTQLFGFIEIERADVDAVIQELELQAHGPLTGVVVENRSFYWMLGYTHCATVTGHGQAAAAVPPPSGALSPADRMLLELKQGGTDCRPTCKIGCVDLTPCGDTCLPPGQACTANPGLACRFEEVCR